MAPKAEASNKGGHKNLQTKSPAEFFAENKNIAGFDNPGKCLYTSIRELVENALDSSESIRELPLVEITVEEISRPRLDRIRGVEHHNRLDEALYEDFETEAQRKKRVTKEGKENDKLQKLIDKRGDNTSEVNAKRKEMAANKLLGQARGSLFYKVTVRDNGSGMAHKDIPNMLGKVLSGTKYGVKQTRGKFGLGAKMALIWSKMTTGLPFEIYSTRKGSSSKSHFILDIDIHKNEPNVHKEEILPNVDDWHGAQLSVTIEGNWGTYRAKVIKYLRQIAVITPYAEFSFFYKAEDERHNMRLVFRRRTDVMPPAPGETKHHPASVDLELIKRLLASTPTKNMVAFLRREFACISNDYAERLVGEMRAGIDWETHPSELNDKQVVRLHQLLHDAKFSDPKGDHLSPAGEYNLRLGVMKELRPELIATYQGDIRTFEGHAFIIEAAVSLGGKDVKPGINVHRFANRIPLLFEGGSDVITKTARTRIAWNSYKINQNSDKVGVFVSLVSTKIPFKGAGKEYIGDDVEEMVAGVKQAIQQCCVQLKSKIARAQAAREQKQRKRNLQKYIPDACNAIWGVLQDMAESEPRGPKRRAVQAHTDVMTRVQASEVSAATLHAKLAEYIDKIDNDAALEYQVQQGIAGAVKDDLMLVPSGPRHAFGPELHASACVLRLLQEF